MAKTKKTSECCSCEGSHCATRVLLVFLLGVIVGGVAVGFLFFYEVLTPAHMETSTLRNYSVPTVELRTVPVLDTSLQSIGGTWGGYEDPATQAIGGTWGGLTR